MPPAISGISAATNQLDVSPTTIPSTAKITPSDDPEVQQLITATKPSSSIDDTPTAPVVAGDQCLTPTVEEEPTLTNEEYIQQLENFIDTADTNQLVNAALLADFHDTYPVPT